MSARKHVSATIEPLTHIHRAAAQAVAQDEQYRYTPDAYHKILDYHVAEILLCTIGLTIIAFLRLHH